MSPDEIKLINNFLHDEEVQPLENKDVKKLADKLDIIVKQMILEEQYHKDLKVLYDELDKLDK